jgi:hypothetical protein
MLDDPQAIAEFVKEIERQMQAVEAAVRLLQDVNRPNMKRILEDLDAERRELMNGLTYFRRRGKGTRG